MLERIAQDSETRRDGRVPRVVLLGDYIDRGDDSQAVLTRLTELPATFPLPAQCLAGNHEAALLSFLDDPERPLETQDDEALLWGRLPQGRSSGMPGHRLVHGHYDGPEVVETPTRICVDTGAYYTGRLTAVRLDAETGYLHVTS
jgi:diadenosine tetraphosphatase ApaH/serine/threonine PP2A family protein phosphatase